LSLVGCGGGGEKAQLAKGGDTSGLLFTPVDTTAKVKRGGTMKTVYTSVNPSSLDPHTAQTFTTLTTISYHAYPRLFKYKVAKYPNFASGESEGDLLESWELSPDKLQITAKVRQGMKWDYRSPTNNREADAEDVVWNWKKFSEVGVRNGDLAYGEVNPGSPVESIKSVDNRTVVIKMKSPDSSIYQLFTSGVIFYVVPREADDKFDSRNTVRGHGPWLLDEYKPSAFFGWVKNPDYYVKGLPLYDKSEQPHVVEYANRVAQFRAGNIWTDVGLTGEDVIPMKKDLPKVNMIEGDAYTTAPSMVSFGYEGNSPFKDLRMRQAIALLIDRETIWDTILNREGYKKEGVDLKGRYSTAIGPAWEGFWLDPLDEKKFGAGAKYLTKFDVAEAKKLVSAAGYPNGVETVLHYVKGQYSATYERTAEVLSGMFAEGGIKAPVAPHDYNNDYIPNYYYSYQGTRSSGFNGMIWRAELAYPTAQTSMYGNIHKDGGRYRGLTPTGLNAKQGDPYLNDLIVRIKQEFDLKKAQEMAWDVQRRMAEQAYYMPAYVSVLGYTLWWPVVGNFGVYRTGPSGNVTVETRAPYWWIDDSQAPLKSV